MPKIPDKVYDVLKWIALLVLPAIAVFYDKVGTIWNWSYVQEITGTIYQIDTLLGALIGLSTLEYNKEKQKKLEEVKKLNGQEE